MMHLSKCVEGPTIPAMRAYVQWSVVVVPVLCRHSRHSVSRVYRIKCARLGVVVRLFYVLL